MNKNERLELIHDLKKFFFCSFLVSFLLLFISSGLYLLLDEFCAKMAFDMFHINRISFYMAATISFTVWKILIVQFTLIPAVVLWCMSKNVAANVKNNLRNLYRGKIFDFCPYKVSIKNHNLAKICRS